MLKDIVRVVALVLAAAPAFAQTPPPRRTFDSFEVATIKLTPSNWTQGRFMRMQSAHQFVAKNHSLKILIAAAYNLSSKAIVGGPAWIDSDRYDILAVTPGDRRPSLDEQMAMLRQLLSERFQLTFHREPKEWSIYKLTLAKGGSKLTESTVTPDPTSDSPTPVAFLVTPPTLRLTGRYATMGELASVFQRAALDRPVLDSTGLSGRYDFEVEFAPDDKIFEGAFGKGDDDSSKPGLFGAIQEQMGLKLEATKGPIDLLVIDRLDRPSDN